MKSYTKHIIKAALLSCFFFISFCSIGQERFNIRDSIGSLANVFIGVQEFEDHYSVYGNGIFLEDSFLIEPMNSVKYSLSGELISAQSFSKEVGIWNLRNQAGNSYINEPLQYCSIGQTYDENTGTGAGFIASFDENGDTIQTILYHSPYIEEYGAEFDFIAPLEIVASTNDDNSFFISTNIFKSGTQTDCWIQRMSPDGESLWSYFYATEANPDGCYSMIPLENGGVLAAISDNILGTKLVEIDSLGQVLSFYDSEVLRRFRDMKKSSDGNLVAVSIFPGEEEGWRPRISKLSPQGAIIWSELFGSDSPAFFIDQAFTKLVRSADGNYVAGGVHYEYLDSFTEENGSFNENGWLVKISDDGEVIWDRKYSFVNSPNDTHTLNDLKATCDGGYIFCGEATDGDTGTPFSEGPPQQGWLVKVDEYGCLVEGCQLFDSIQEPISPDEIIFTFSPNPASNFLNIYQGQQVSALAVYELHDYQGKLLESFPASECFTTMMVDVSAYSSGNYILSLREGDKLLQSEKVIIQ